MEPQVLEQEASHQPEESQVSPGFFDQGCKIMDENSSILATRDIQQLNELTQDGMLICIYFTFAAIDLPGLPYFR